MTGRPAVRRTEVREPQALLAWYDRHRRVLPWRAPPGQPADPYRVWLSEIMLQQTTVTAVAPYYRGSWRGFPRSKRSPEAEIEEVLKLWAGLGYYARARNLHACARVVAARGGFPDREEELMALPGIGAYTAAAIAAIAFGRPATAVDGNVERVVARLFAIEEALPGAKARIRALAGQLTPPQRPGDFAQAMMDLGATICTPQGAGLRAVPATHGRARRGAAAIRRTFRAARRNAPGACAAAPPSWRSAPTAMFWCAGAPPRACSAA